MTLKTRRPRVVIVDDSAVSRGVLAEALADRGIDVVGRAMDGSFGLRLVLDLAPDVVTCDLEMPRMDGMTFLRILTQKKPTPVIVVSSDSRPESVLTALELGARDFVVKPDRQRGSLARVGDQLAQRIVALTQETRAPISYAPVSDLKLAGPVDVVAVGASTGGPTAIRALIADLKAPPTVPVLIAQHMPPRFTAAFAERLARRSGLDVQEARANEHLLPGMIRVAPGGQSLEVVRVGHRVLTRLVPPGGDPHVPSVDRLMTTVGSAYKERALGIVMTGMGRDGAAGAERMAGFGATIWCEDESTAVIAGMPNAAFAASPLAQRAPLDALAAGFFRVCTSAQ